MSVNWSLPFDERVRTVSRSTTMTPREYEAMHERSLENWPEFWEGVASELPWHRRWDKVLDDSAPPFYRWFVGGELNACSICVDRHAAGHRASKPAIIWEGEAVADRGPTVRTMTYADVHREVNRAAWVLKHRYGVAKGDTVGFYMPMVPEFPIFMLAAVRLGAKFTVVFSGFSSDSLSERLNDAGAKVLVTADGGRRRGSVVRLKDIVDGALQASSSVKSVLVLKNVGNSVNMETGRDEYIHDALARAPADAAVEPVSVRSDDPLFILHTSGTTGRPKGQVHDVGGYLVLLHATMRWVFDLNDDDVYWCTADIGWVTGHSYIVFGPLMEGATVLMYEGALDHPSPDRWASILERHRVSVLYTSPTAIRSFMKNGDAWAKAHDTSSVRVMHSVGEPINPEAFRWMRRNVGEGQVPFGSTWWMTETGGIMISVLPGLGLVPIKPGTNGFPIPGVEAAVVDEQGLPQKPFTRGLLVLKRPWPGMPLTIHNDPSRYKEVYWSRFPGSFFAGDYAVRDGEGYFWILGRADEVIKVSGHRLGTYELESALVQHPSVAEAAVVGVPDEVKGEAPVGFVILRVGANADAGLASELKALVREKVGPIATPREVFFVGKLPKTRSAKIMRRVIRAVAVGQSVGDVSTLEEEASVDEIRRAYADFRGEVSGAQDVAGRNRTDGRPL